MQTTLSSSSTIIELISSKHHSINKMPVTTVTTPIGAFNLEYSESFNKNVIVLIDKSGSMGYSHVNNYTRTRLSHSTNFILKLAEQVEVRHLIAFDHEAKIITPHDLTTTVRASGWTSFSVAFQTATECFITGLNIIFIITDGATNPDDVEQSIRYLKLAVDTPGVYVQVHGIGIEADPEILLKLAQVDIAGSVLHLKTAEDFNITEFVSTAVGLIECGSVCKFVWPAENELPILDIVNTDEDVQLAVFRLLQREITKNAKSSEIIKKVTDMNVLLQHLKISKQSMRKLDKEQNELWKLAHANLPRTDFYTQLAKLHYAPNDNGKLKLQLSKVVVSNAERAKRIIENIHPLDPFDFSGSTCWSRKDYACTLSTFTPEEAYKEQHIFCLAIYTKTKAIGVVEPEILKATVQAMYLCWKSFTEAVPYAIKKKNINGKVTEVVEDSVIENIDGLTVNCVMPLIPNNRGFDLLEVCAAIWSTGDAYALNRRATHAMPFVILQDIYTRERIDWLQDAQVLVENMCRFTLQPSFTVVAESFGEDDYRFADTLPSLALFILRCIVSRFPITIDLVNKIFGEESRRRVNHEHNWDKRNMWNSDIEKSGMLGQHDFKKMINAVKSNWQHGIIVHSPLPEPSAALRTYPNDVFISNKIGEICDYWNISYCNQILRRFYEENNKPIIDPTQRFIEMKIHDKLMFLAECKLKPEHIRSKKKPDIAKYNAPSVVAEFEKVKMMDSGAWREFSETEKLDDAVAIWALIPPRDTKRFRKLLNDPVNSNIPLYKLKLSISTSDWYHVRRREDIDEKVVEFEEFKTVKPDFTEPSKRKKAITSTSVKIIES